MKRGKRKTRTIEEKRLEKERVRRITGTKERRNSG